MFSLSSRTSDINLMQFHKPRRLKRDPFSFYFQSASRKRRRRRRRRNGAYAFLSPPSDFPIHMTYLLFSLQACVAVKVIPFLILIAINIVFPLYTQVCGSEWKPIFYAFPSSPFVHTHTSLFFPSLSPLFLERNKPRRRSKGKGREKDFFPETFET